MNESPHGRRQGDFIERLSMLLVIGAFIGGFVVLLDVRLEIRFFDQVILIGKDGFSPEVKGVVIQSMLITGFAAVVAFWLGTTKQGQDQAKSVSRIAEGNPQQATKSDTVNLETEQTIITEKEKPT